MRAAAVGVAHVTPVNSDVSKSRVALYCSRLYIDPESANSDPGCPKDFLKLLIRIE